MPHHKLGTPFITLRQDLIPSTETMKTLPQLNFELFKEVQRTAWFKSKTKYTKNLLLKEVQERLMDFHGNRAQKLLLRIELFKIYLGNELRGV